MAECDPIGNHNVLLVDDDPFMLKLVTAALKVTGIERVVTTESGKEALRLIDERKDFDVVLCDLNMPEMDGLEMLRLLGEAGFGGGVILISGEDAIILDTTLSLAKAHDLNVLGAIEKPVSPDALSALLPKLQVRETARGARPSIKIEEDELRAGIENDEIVVFYQPKVSVATKALIGVEALVRWRRADGNLVPPGFFIPLAEDTGLIDALTQSIMDQAINQAGNWARQDMPVKVSINVSVDSLDRLDIPALILAAAEKAETDPALLMVEVTESRLMADIAKPLELLTRLRLNRIGLSIDDFGTGHSSMEQLKQIPFTELKIDRAFVHGAATDHAAQAILGSSVELAKRMNMTTVAEGVETQADWDQVAALSVDLVQGYFIAKPMPEAEFTDWARDWRAAN